MGLLVEIDGGSGFCGGVIRAISRAEEFLRSGGAVPSGVSGGDTHRKLFSLGSIVHNEAELSRLSSLGLRTVHSLEDVPHGETVLIRAHGEPPSTYLAAEKLGLRLIDCTCPVVLGLQRKIREASARLSSGGGQLIIFGKHGHAEVLGLKGQVPEGILSFVVDSLDELKELASGGRIVRDAPTEIFSQTTKSPDGYREVCDFLRNYLVAPLSVHDTICAQVRTRHSSLREFARNHDVILFVSGASSSNGQVLSNICLEENPCTHRISSAEEIDPLWFDGASSVGICGATSTPKWLLEDVAAAVKTIER